MFLRLCKGFRRVLQGPYWFKKRRLDRGCEKGNLQLFGNESSGHLGASAARSKGPRGPSVFLGMYMA